MWLNYGRGMCCPARIQDLQFWSYTILSHKEIFIPCAVAILVLMGGIMAALFATRTPLSVSVSVGVGLVTLYVVVIAALFMFRKGYLDRQEYENTPSEQFKQEGADQPSSAYYFAYGSNMDVDRMMSRMENGPQQLQNKGRWEGSLNLEKFTVMGSAVLEGYEIDFSKIKSTSLIEGFATIFPSPTQHVEGVLYQLNEKHLQVLDFYEGFHGESNESNEYDRAHVSVTRAGKALDAVVYIAHPSQIDKSRKPSKKYLEFLLKGARQFSLSEDYIRKLEAIPTID